MFTIKAGCFFYTRLVQNFAQLIRNNRRLPDFHGAK